MTLTSAPLAQIDSPAMRQAGRDLLSLALMDARNHTLGLLGQFEKAGLEPAATALWLAGQAGWFGERWIGRNTQRALGNLCPAQPVRLASIEPRADALWDAAGPPQSAAEMPDAPSVRAYLLDTLESTLELLEKSAGDDTALYFFRLALFHEDLLGERLIVLAQTLGVPLALDAPAIAAPREALLLPAQRWQLGSPPPGTGGATPAGFVFDNEKWAHEVAVPAFEIDAQPVSWAQFVEFVDDGGYDRQELWDSDGWAWLEDHEDGRRCPRHVEQIGVARFGGSGAVMQTRFGRTTRVAGGQAAMHVNWWEADAWCRWAGRRLPSEAEWELAAHQAAQRGFRWGVVQEWMAGGFRPYPGFAPDPVADYSQPWFGRAKVLRGASFAARARLKHPRFRGFAPPGWDEGFVGFRSCAI